MQRSLRSIILSTAEIICFGRHVDLRAPKDTTAGI